MLPELFACEPLHARLSVKQCVANHREATSDRHGTMGSPRRFGLAACRECPIGAEHTRTNQLAGGAELVAVKAHVSAVVPKSGVKEPRRMPKPKSPSPARTIEPEAAKTPEELLAELAARVKAIRAESEVRPKSWPLDVVAAAVALRKFGVSTKDIAEATTLRPGQISGWNTNANALDDTPAPEAPKPPPEAPQTSKSTKAPPSLRSRGLEPVDVIEAWNLPYHLGRAVEALWEASVRLSGDHARQAETSLRRWRERLAEQVAHG